MLIILLLVSILVVCAAVVTGRDKSSSKDTPTEKPKQEKPTASQESVPKPQQQPKQTVFTAELVEPPKRSTQPVQRPVRQSVQFDIAMFQFLLANGVEFIDNRSKNGALWIVGGSQLGDIARECKYRFGVTFTFKPEGGQCTKHRPAWWTRSYASKSTVVTDAAPQISRGKSTKQIEGQTSIQDILAESKIVDEFKEDRELIAEGIKQRDELLDKKEKALEKYHELENMYDENKKRLDKTLTNDLIEFAVESDIIDMDRAEELKKNRNDLIRIVTTASKSKSSLKELISSYDKQISELSGMIDALCKLVNQ